MNKPVRTVFGLMALVALVFISATLFFGTRTIHDVLNENKRLKKALATLTEEEQIGYAKVVRQETRNGKLYTAVRFVETARNNPQKTVLEREYEIEGDIVHFDALIVTFPGQAVMDGKERSLYLWRRIYGEKQPPAFGFAIEKDGVIPARYSDLLKRLHFFEKTLFWTAIWDLASNPEALRQYGIKAIYGNTVYQRLQPGSICVLKISPTGQLIPETVPAL